MHKSYFKELKAQQREWADLDGLNTSHWTETMTWEQMQDDRFKQMGLKKRRDANGKEKWVKTKGN